MNIKNQKTKTFFALAIATTTLLNGTACNAPAEQKSNLSKDADESAKTLEQRLANTIRVRQLGESLEKSLRKVDGAFNDMRRILRLESDRLEGELPNFAVNELVYAVRSLSKGMVTTGEDGTWTIEKEVEWPFARMTANPENCASSRVGLTGRNQTADGQSLTAEVYVRDCSLGGKRTLARLERDAQGKVHADFDASRLDGVADTSVRVGQCTLEIGQNAHEVELVCAPFKTIVATHLEGKSSKILLEFGALKYSKASGGSDSLYFTVSAFRADGSHVKSYEVEKVEGDQIRATPISESAR
jgi:hypothetical protein